MPDNVLLKYADFFDVSADYILGRCDDPHGKKYSYQPEYLTNKLASSGEWREFVEMCFDPNSPVNNKLKEMIIQMAGGNGNADEQQWVFWDTWKHQATNQGSPIQVNFYLSAIDDKLKHELDNPSIGILLCKERNKLTAEYALKDIDKPIGVSEYILSGFVPTELADTLPSVDDIEKRINAKYEIEGSE